MGIRLIRRFLVWAVIVSMSWFAVGCGFGTRFIFSSSSDDQGTPDERGLVYEDVWFPTSDGVRLHGWYLPGDSSAPLVVFFHGNAANITHRLVNLEYLHRLGLSVFIFDYRGFGASGGRALNEQDLYRDARGALDWLAERSWRPGRMIYFGRSLGAAVALQMALERPPAGVVLESAFTSLRAIAREMTPVTYALFGWWSIGARFDNLGKIPRLSRPLLIIYGEGDDIIPPEMSRSLFAVAAEPKRLLSVPGAGHSDCFEAGEELYRRAWLDFIAQAFDRPAPNGLRSSLP